jgi:enoyl-CoA hydratase/carnithine racemase
VSDWSAIPPTLAATTVPPAGIGVEVVDLDADRLGDAELRRLRENVAFSARAWLGLARRPLDARALAVARALTCTVVPVGADDDDALVGAADPDAAVTDLVDRARRNPTATAALARLLRVTGAGDVAAGLAAESAVYSTLLAGTEFHQWLTGRRSGSAPVGTGASPVVRVERQDDVLTLTIDRPQRHNAFDRFVRDGLADAFDIALADDSITAVALRGAGPSFCSGGDLAEFGTAGDVSAAHLLRLERSVAARVARCPSPVTAHLHGACIGAGIEIPSFASHVVAAADSVIRLPEVAMGLIPGAGGTVGITRRIGRWRTAFLALGGAALPVDTALRWGLVDAVLDH